MTFAANTSEGLASFIEDHNLDQFSYSVVRFGRGVFMCEGVEFFGWVLEVEFND